MKPLHSNAVLTAKCVLLFMLRYVTNDIHAR